MRNVLCAALIMAAATTTAWAQAPAPPPAPVPLFNVAPPVPVTAPPVLFDVAQPALAPGPVPLLNFAQAAPAQPAAPAPAGRERVVQVVPVQPAPPAPAAVPATTAPRFANPPRNIRFDIVITETGGPKPTTKTISLTVNDSNGSGSVRNLVKVPELVATVSLNVDVRAVQAFEGGAIRAAVNVEYQPYTPDASAPPSGIQSSITSMFQDGRRTQILQTSDPLSDRRTTIEVTATVLK